MPDEAEQPVSAINAPGESQEVSDAAHGSKDSLEDLRNPVLDQYVALMTYMQATRAEIVRGICAFRVLQGAPRLWWRGRLHQLHRHSEMVTLLDEFWSHSWLVHPATKYLSVLFLNNGLPAFVAGAACAFVTFSLYAAGLLPWKRMCTPSGAVGYYLTLLLWRCKKRVFLDVACVNQHDPQLKMEALVSIGAFLKRSRSLLVLWDATFVSRLWCMFEMAAFLHSHGLETRGKSLVICPVFVGPVFVIGNLGLCVLCMIFNFWPLPLFPSGGLLIATLTFPCLTLVSYIVLLHCRNIETMQKQVRHFTVQDSSSHCCASGHYDKRTGEHLICDRSIILRCVSAWFGSTEQFESLVRGKLLEVLVDQLANGTFTYWRLVQVNSPVLWVCLDILQEFLDNGLNMFLTLILYWLMVLPNMALIMLRLTYMVRLWCESTFARVLLAVGLVAVGTVLFGLCYATQVWLLPGFLTYLQSNLILVIFGGLVTLLLWCCVPAIRSPFPDSTII
ncbi:unnamed protein product [Symbiodinium necroappetens]|uniref:Uncharacterized protein n=1 Tax=Symbiodinium necroappetens TaxID=1628268 RepID=A0A812S886_9DINO|nr:unnamed protein product [Symbiodinium necroappetens]